MTTPHHKMHDSIMSTGEENLVPIPNDLIFDIFSRLPADSVARFRCLSKLWASILHHPDFTELFLTRSRARPRLLFALKREGAWSFYSLPQRQQHDHLYDKASTPPLVAYPDFHIKFPEDIHPEYNGFTSGLIYFSSMQITPNSQKEPVICEPRTGQYATLPKLLRTRYGKIFLGFDPIGKQFKVLFIMTRTDYSDAHRILTLGNGIMKWRKIECSCSYLFRQVTDEGICINGILYFLAKRPCYFGGTVEIVCFDVRSEKFKSIDVEGGGSWYVKLVNYKEKLGVVTRKGLYEWRLSVLEDFEKQEWSKHVYTLPKNDIIDSNYFIAGVTATGEIAFSRNHTSGPFYVVYFSIESNTLRSVEIRGLESDHSVCAYVDLIEDLYVSAAKYFKSSPRLNVITNLRPKPQERNSIPSVNNNQQSTSLLLQN